MQYGEPGVFMAFEETAEELTQNVRSLGFDLDELAEQKKLVVDFVRVERSEIEETGDYDLEGLFVRLGHAIDTIGAKRVVLDTIETLFGGLSNDAILRAELRRLFRWLKDKGVTAVITGERGEGTLTRHGLEEYVSDCVILLDHRVIDQVSTRRLRIVKYRGTTHGTNEYPVPDRRGRHQRPAHHVAGPAARGERRADFERHPAAGRDAGRPGLFPGQQRARVAARRAAARPAWPPHFADAACGRGERCLYFAFEESPGQIVRNMRSIGVDLEPWVKKGLLHFHAIRSTLHGLEMHLATFHKLVQEFQPRVVVLDPIGSLVQAGSRDGRDGDADAPDRLPEGAADHGALDQPDAGRRPAWKARTWTFPRWWTPGCCCATSSWAASATASCTSSSRAAWPTPIRSASSC